MDAKPNFRNNFFDIIHDKDLVIETEILKVKLEKIDKENAFLRGEVKYIAALLNARIPTSFHIFKT